MSTFVAFADLELSVNITATKAVQLDDVSVRLAPTNHTAQMMCGMGTEGSYLHDIGWNWDMTMGNNRKLPRYRWHLGCILLKTSC